MCSTRPSRPRHHLHGHAVEFPPRWDDAPPRARQLDRATRKHYLAELQRTDNAAWWERMMKGRNFAREDALDVGRFNRALWEGMMGTPYR